MSSGYDARSTWNFQPPALPALRPQFPTQSWSVLPASAFHVYDAHASSLQTDQPAPKRSCPQCLTPSYLAPATSVFNVYDEQV